MKASIFFKLNRENYKLLYVSPCAIFVNSKSDAKIVFYFIRINTNNVFMLESQLVIQYFHFQFHSKTIFMEFLK